MKLWRQARDVFIRALEQRLETGHTEHGDRSFARHPVDLIDEVQQEALDISGWSFIMWHRLQGVRQALASWVCPHCGKPVDLGGLLDEGTSVPDAEPITI